MTDRRGIVWIAPTDPVPTGCIGDPATSTFWASWQHDAEGLLEDAEMTGAEAAIAWGRERAQVVRIRLGHTDDSYFSAGVRRVRSLPDWPPPEPPPGGWWSRGDPRTDPSGPPAPGHMSVSKPALSIRDPSEASE